MGRPGVANRLSDVGRKVDDELAMNDEVVVGLLEIQCEHFCIVSVRSGVSTSMGWKYIAGHTVTAQFQINDICDSDVHNAEEPLITLLEFALVKNLDGDDRRVLDIAGM